MMQLYIAGIIAVGIIVSFSESEKITGTAAQGRHWVVQYPVDEWPNCTLNHGRVRGTCEKIVKCDEAVEAIFRGYHPPICYWERHQDFPLVCCPSFNDGDIYIDVPFAGSGHGLPPTQLDCGLFPEEKRNTDSRKHSGDGLTSRNPVDASLGGGKRGEKNSNSRGKTRKDDDPPRFQESSWPWAVKVYHDSEGRHLMQNGFLVDKQNVVTTAQIIVSEKSTPKSVRFSNGLLVQVSKTVVHEDFKPWVKYNDIAVLQLKDSIEDDFVQPVCVPSINLNATLLAGIHSSVIGTLKTERVPIVAHSWCEETYSKFSPLTYPRGITEQFLCGGLQLNDEPQSGVGDAGGAVMFKDETNHWTAIGMVSLDYKCANQGFPGVYINLGYFNDWIRKTIQF